MPDYRFVLLNADQSVLRDCILYADTGDEALEIAQGLLPGLSVEVWKDTARIHVASRSNPLEQSDRNRDTTRKDNDEKASLRHRYRAEELRALDVLIDDEKAREALLIVAAHSDSLNVAQM